MAEILESPKFVDKWALRYIHLYRTVGSDEAKKWAVEFLPPVARDKMSDRVRELLKQGV